MSKVITGYDIVVVGGGINGAGIARDAALRGLRVLLLEKKRLWQRDIQLVQSPDTWWFALPGIC
jgi:flavin-dependent dehydrogenase